MSRVTRHMTKLFQARSHQGLQKNVSPLATYLGYGLGPFIRSYGYPTALSLIPSRRCNCSQRGWTVVKHRLTIIIIIHYHHSSSSSFMIIVHHNYHHSSSSIINHYYHHHHHHSVYECMFVSVCVCMHACMHACMHV